MTSSLSMNGDSVFVHVGICHYQSQKNDGGVTRDDPVTLGARRPSQ